MKDLKPEAASAPPQGSDEVVSPGALFRCVAREFELSDAAEPTHCPSTSQEPGIATVPSTEAVVNGVKDDAEPTVTKSPETSDAPLVAAGSAAVAALGAGAVAVGEKLFGAGGDEQAKAESDGKASAAAAEAATKAGEAKDTAMATATAAATTAQAKAAETRDMAQEKAAAATEAAQTQAATAQAEAAKQGQAAVDKAGSTQFGKDAIKALGLEQSPAADGKLEKAPAAQGQVPPKEPSQLPTGAPEAPPKAEEKPESGSAAPPTPNKAPETPSKADNRKSLGQGHSAAASESSESPRSRKPSFFKRVKQTFSPKK